ncbi:MAG: dihydropteroate synthase [Nitrospinota bacterium]
MPYKSFRVGRVHLKPGRPLIVGVLNVTPDSFSDGGSFYKKAKAVDRALRMEEEGADIIDVGGESSRPFSKPVTLKEELRRVIPVIEAIRKKSSVPISIDSCKPEVARAAALSGADMLNDITGFTAPAMAELAADLKKPVVIMHMKGDPRTMQKAPRYKDVAREVTGFLKRRAKILEKLGVRRIIVDPGIGFGKTIKHNLELLKNIDKFSALGYPVMVGASRKSFIGKISGANIDDRLGGSLSAHLWSINHGASLIRVHDVAAHRQALDIYGKIHF